MFLCARKTIGTNDSRLSFALNKALVLHTCGCSSLNTKSLTVSTRSGELEEAFSRAAAMKHEWLALPATGQESVAWKCPVSSTSLAASPASCQRPGSCWGGYRRSRILFSCRASHAICSYPCQLNKLTFHLLHTIRVMQNKLMGCGSLLCLWW